MYLKHTHTHTHTLKTSNCSLLEILKIFINARIHLGLMTKKLKRNSLMQGNFEACESFLIEL